MHARWILLGSVSLSLIACHDGTPADTSLFTSDETSSMGGPSTDASGDADGTTAAQGTESTGLEAGDGDATGDGDGDTTGAEDSTGQNDTTGDGDGDGDSTGDGDGDSESTGDGDGDGCGEPEICDGLDNDCTGVADDGDGTCPCPVAWYGDRPYQICAGANVQQRTWQQAEMACAATPGYALASANTQLENEFIYTSVAMSLNPPIDSVWLGATDYCDTNMDLINDCEGTWVWVTGEPWVYTNWATNGADPDEPNNIDGIEHCLQIGRNGDATWNDADCDITLIAAVCQTTL